MNENRGGGDRGPTRHQSSSLSMGRIISRNINKHWVFLSSVGRDNVSCEDRPPPTPTQLDDGNSTLGRNVYTLLYSSYSPNMFALLAVCGGKWQEERKK